MSVVAFFSAKGAPGVTTTALVAASLWPRQVLLADCDPAGGDVGLRLPAPTGRPLDMNRGMLSLIPQARRTLAAHVVLDHAQDILGGGQVLVGVGGPEQASAGGPLWDTIARAFTAIPGRDVIVDAGRLDVRSPVFPVVASADVAVCVMTTSLASTYATRARLRTLVPALQPGATGPHIGLMVHGEDRREAEEAARVIQSEFAEVSMFGHLATDRVGAGIFEGRPVSRPERTLLVRSERSALEGVIREVDRRRRPDESDPGDRPGPETVGPAVPDVQPAGARSSDQRSTDQGPADQRSAAPQPPGFARHPAPDPSTRHDVDAPPNGWTTPVLAGSGQPESPARTRSEERHGEPKRRFGRGRKARSDTSAPDQGPPADQRQTAEAGRPGGHRGEPS